MLIYIIPLIVFITVFLLSIFSGFIWNKFFSAKTKNIQARISEIKSSLPNLDNSLVKSSRANNYKWIIFLKKRLPYIDKLKLILLRSGVNLSIDEILMIVPLIMAITVLGLIIFSSLSLVIVISIAILMGISPVLYLLRKAEKKRVQFESQLPDALDFLSRALKAGHGMSSAIGMLANEFPDPIGQEFKNVFDELNFGLPFNESMLNLTLRVNSSDLNFFVVALSIQRETGGNLTELLESLSMTIRERIKLGGKVRILAAEGKYSGVLLSVFPFIMATVLSLINPKYMSALWITESGKNLVTTGLIMMVVGGFWMSRIVKIKV